ncbi:MAG: hypothetical protein ACK4S4_05445 [Pyrinomonadaceae bacterium]
MMIRSKLFNRLAGGLIVLLGLAGAAEAQRMTAPKSGVETITGTVVLYGTGANTRTYVLPFTLRLTGRTSADEVRDLVGLLQEGDQRDVLDKIDDRDLGSFSLNNRIGPRINFVHEDMVDGQRRLFVAFRRWMQFAELRGGYRSTDYPFGVFEIYIDPRTGRGSGTYIPAAQVRWRTDKRTGAGRVEIENFATFPGRLMGVVSSRRG